MRSGLKSYIIHRTPLLERCPHHQTRWSDNQPSRGQCLGLWDLDLRGEHEGVWRFFINGNPVLAIGIPHSEYSWVDFGLHCFQSALFMISSKTSFSEVYCHCFLTGRYYITYIRTLVETICIILSSIGDPGASIQSWYFEQFQSKENEIFDWRT